MLVLTKVPLGSSLPVGLAGLSASGGVPRDWLPDAAEQEPGATPRSGAAPRHALRGQLRTSISLALSLGPSGEVS